MPAIDTFVAVADRVHASAQGTRLVAVDGCGGAGKSTFAERLARACDGAPIVATDHFASWDNPIDWWPRLLEEVIEPLSVGRAARYQWYDWEQRTIGGWREVEPEPVVIIEGVSSSRSEWVDRLAFIIWVETPRALRLDRGLQRDGEGARALWMMWMQAEDAYVARDAPTERADVIVDGAPVLHHDPEREFVRINPSAD
ncbi:MAG: aminodeoxychorismate synthase [Acidimicrobiia bacterium]